jgi:hypothetical protein
VQRSLAEAPRSRWCFERAARDVFQTEILVEINQFMPGERSDHERRLAADDLRPAIEEVYQPIEQAIARNGRASVYRSLLGIASFRMDALYPNAYSDIQSRRLVLWIRIGFQPGLPHHRRWSYLLTSEVARGFHMGAKSTPAQTDGRLPKP